MGCNSCENLKTDKKKAGKTNGSLYYCSKLKTYVNGSSDGCDKYKKDIMRKITTTNEIYRDGKKYYDGVKSIGATIWLALILFIIALIVNLF